MNKEKHRHTQTDRNPKLIEVDRREAVWKGRIKSSELDKRQKL